MRSTVLRFFALGYSVALAFGLGVVACSDSSSTRFSNESAGGDHAPNAEGDTSFNTSEAGSSGNNSLLGSPLCQVRPGSCSPDDDGTKTLANGEQRCPPHPDDDDSLEQNDEEEEGDEEEEAPDASTSTRACRLQTTTRGVSPYCFDEADRRGVDGVSCESGRDCAPGFDCVSGEKGAVCRRYCCAGSCQDQLSRNGGPTFCDIRRLVNEQPAPVCMPIKTCTLLRPGDCSPTETCAIVTNAGETGCVPKGNAGVGEPCDTDHCKDALTCLGSPGDRRCYELCKVGSSDCGPMQTCATGTAFQDTSFGVCKND